MKNRIIYLLILLVGLYLWSGCKKSNSNNTTTPTSFVKATINGQAFTGTSTGSGMSGTRITLSGGVAGGTDPGYPQIVLSAGIYNGIGTYDLGTSANYASVDSSFSGTPAQALYGTFTVSTVTPNITGTFSFTCFDSTKVTGGTFSCPKL